MIKRFKVSIATVALASMMLTSGSGVAVLAETTSTEATSTTEAASDKEAAETKENNEE